MSRAASESRPAEIARLAATIRAATATPFGLNLLLFQVNAEAIEGVIAARPAVLSTAWPATDQDLVPIFARAHANGLKVMHIASTIHSQARRSGWADFVVAQGTEGGGHVGEMGTFVLVPMVVRAVAPVPVLAAGGIADGASLAAALMLGAEGVLLGTRFLATDESPLPEGYKQAICRSDGSRSSTHGRRGERHGWLP